MDLLADHSGGGEPWLSDHSKQFQLWLGKLDVAVNRKGWATDDEIYGGSKNDTLSGLAGDDRLQGNGGNDLIRGGRGSDTLLGNSGADIFDFNSSVETRVGAERDVILGFRRAQHDTIDLEGIDANTLRPGNQTFKFIGAQSFESHFGQHPGQVGILRFANGLLQGDVNRDRIADFEIKVAGAASLGSVDLEL